MIDVDELLPTPDAVRLTGRSHETLRLWAKTGRVKAQRLGGRLWMYDRADLERMVTEMDTKLRKIGT